MEWLESALQPAGERLGRQRFDDLVAALTVAIGWEAFFVLTDIRGLDLADARRVTSHTARTLIHAALADHPQNPPS